MSAKQLKAFISKNYKIGELRKARKLDRGYVNTSYEIETVRDGRENRYFLRKYKKGIKEEELRFEHSIIQHLMKKNFKLAAGIVHTKEGKTYIQQFEDNKDKDKKEYVFMSLFEFLPGEDKYTWDNPACNDEELRNAAAVLAQYHDTICDLIPEGKRHEPRIIDLLPHIADNLKNCAKRAGKTKFDAFFIENLDSILRAIDRTRNSIDKKKYQGMVHLAIHCDYHPGNLKFQNERVAGLFDFDWSKIDARCFDVALAIMYFCSAWKGKEDGDLQLNKIAVFLDTYQKTLQATQEIGPLNDVERKCLAHMIRASNIYVLHWDVENFYTKNVNPYEYSRYLRHNVLLMKWLESNKNLNKLEKIIMESTPAGVNY